MNFQDFFKCFWNLFFIFTDFNSFKMAKMGVNFPHEQRADVAWDPRGCDMARKAMWQRHEDPRERLCGTNVARTRGRATRAHADTRVVPAWHEE